MNMAQALEIIESGKVVKLLYVPFDKKRKTGGGKKTLEEVVITVPKSERDPSKATEMKAANHRKNDTRNFYRCINGVSTSSIVTVHIFLMLEVDGIKIML